MCAKNNCSKLVLTFGFLEYKTRAFACTSTCIVRCFAIELLKVIFRIFSSPEPKAQGELIVWDLSRRPSVRASTLSNMNISETSWPIIIKFHQEHHWGGGLTGLGFGKDRIRTLVSMATDSSVRVIMGKIL